MKGEKVCVVAYLCQLDKIGEHFSALADRGVFEDLFLNPEIELIKPSSGFDNVGGVNLFVSTAPLETKELGAFYRGEVGHVNESYLFLE